MKHFILSLTFLFSYISFSQISTTSQNTEISIITIGPGNSLNDAFGHNGFRVKNDYIDVIYDYGRYNFEDPNFYTNFARGKLKYLMGKSRSKDVILSYKRQNRSIKEQVLNLNENQKRELYRYLVNNNKPENRAYLYDFFYDNCATKMRDVSESVLNSNIEYINPDVYKAETFRTLIQNNLNWNSWGSLGIDIALGSVIDKKAEPREYMFLPENVFQFFEKAKFKGTDTPLVKKSKVIYTPTESYKKGNFLMSPIFILGLVGLFILWVTYKDNKKEKRSKWLDVSIFLITGVIGVFILLLWFATDHTATAFNYNLLWAFPFSLIVISQAYKTIAKRWFIKFIKLLIIMLCLMALHWIVGVQRFAPALFPLAVALIVRYVYLIKFYKSQAQ
ncbi:DUF4105 domain-containing protein [uncultured Lacinutrix sp.]|uniref:lipoprotein N-acyltransferase Lnb domain-containing protein n=1 Tax=uncultured Lacinutrix sp. TaxID=574032 RepID=UPI00260D87D2|nr:DUF4105 domain-containing protein [uncultured Lacinutrix sp.]